MSGSNITPCTCYIGGCITPCKRHDPIIGLSGLRAPAAAPVFVADNYGTTGRWLDADSTAHMVAQGALQFPGTCGDPGTIEKTPTGRVIHAEMGAAIFRPAKPPAAEPISGPLGDLIALTDLIPTQPTTEQWQTLKQAISDLAGSQNAS